MTELSKDSISRSIKVVSERDKKPESHFWETAEAQEWLLLERMAALPLPRKPRQQKLANHLGLTVAA
ncbi:hypothetical protein QUF58_10250 [Anaerolineales bacterium HSG24]|nr:hypothetical protein [Anaerolineales bacterium HSG24]